MLINFFLVISSPRASNTKLPTHDLSIFLLPRVRGKKITMYHELWMDDIALLAYLVKQPRRIVVRVDLPAAWTRYIRMCSGGPGLK